jgi:hypothetical protein
MVSFGCTGGQHRSVYCTEIISKWIREKYNVNLRTNHYELGGKDSDEINVQKKKGKKTGSTAKGKEV